MVGGTICGYWATGKLYRQTAPNSMMTMAMTLAKIGRSMKNLDMRSDFYVLNMGKASVDASYPERLVEGLQSILSVIRIYAWKTPAGTDCDARLMRFKVLLTEDANRDLECLRFAA